MEVTYNRKGEEMRVAVCITTYRRLEGLRRLLVNLGELTFTKNDVPALSIVVIDNECARETKQMVEQLASSYVWELAYVEEPLPGVSNARNRALHTVKDTTDFMAFVDDDEVVEPAWLDELLHVQKTYGADVVAGPVLSRFEGDVPEWVIKGKFFDRQRYETGHVLKYVASGNVLISSAVLRQTCLIFDERLTLTGGEDTHFFMRLHQMGYKMVWADRAVAYEYVPNNRTTMDWIIKRAYRTGNTITFCEIDLLSSPFVKIRRLLMGCGKMLEGILQWLPSLLIGKHSYCDSLRKIYRGMGMLAALKGSLYKEYQHQGRKVEQQG